MNSVKLSESKRTKIGIIAAMNCEIDILKKAIGNPVIENIAGCDYYSGTIGNHDVVLVKCGIGKVSAAVGAQAMISSYKPDFIINTGCAGAISPKLDVGDFVLAEKTVEWDIDTTLFGDPRGYVDALGKVEMIADKALSEEIYNVFSDEKIVRGMIVTGDQFVSSNSQREVILSAFPEAMCAEMEGGAIGHVCEQNKVPFCILRCMSDNANGDSGIDYPEFSVKAGKKSAEHIIKLLNK